MRIGFDISQTGKQKAGCGYFADGLIGHLAEIDSQNDYILYPTFGDSFWDPDWASGTCRIPQPNFHNGLGHKTFEAAKFFWSHPPENFEAQLGNPDILHANNFFCPRGLRKARLVYTLYDLSFLVHPEWTTEQNRTTCFQGVFDASLHADLIISISEYSRNHFLGVFPHYPAERIRVVYPASRFSGTEAGSRPENLSSLGKDRFWLNVGVLEPRKNHRGLLRAYARFSRKQREECPLVLAGGGGWLMDDFQKDLEALDLTRDVIMIGYTDDMSLRWLYQNCLAFVYPSLFEGFGMPVLEAMSLGAPVVTSKVSSIPEIVGQAGILIDAGEADTIYQGMSQLAADEGLREALKQKAKQRASSFSWKASASRVLDLYREIILRGKNFSGQHESSLHHSPGGPSC